MNMQQDWFLELGRLTALAERFSSEGQMNLNKLLEAAVYSQVRRMGWHYRPEVTLATMDSELESSLRFLKQESNSPTLITALETGLQALNENRHGDLLFTEAPDVFVCRTCGHIALGSAPDHCPDCGAWAGRFRKFVAFFNQDNLEPTNPMEIIAMLAQNAEDLRRLVADLNEDVTSKAPSANEWSIHEHVKHFSDTQDMLDTRIELMLNHDNPNLTALAVYEFAKQEEQRPSTTQDVLSTFCDKRANCVSKLESLPLKDLWRTGSHPEFGQLTIIRQSAYMAFHEQSHLPEIEALRKQVT
jgi:rubrerythrin